MKRVAVTVAGVLLGLAGLVLTPLPGPGIVVLVAGLALLATEYAWARRALDWARGQAEASAARTAASRTLTTGALLGGAALIGAGLAEIVGIDLPWVNVLTAVLLVAGGGFLVATTARERRRHLRRVRAQPARVR